MTPLAPSAAGEASTISVSAIVKASAPASRRRALRSEETRTERTCITLTQSKVLHSDFKKLMQSKAGIIVKICHLLPCESGAMTMAKTKLATQRRFPATSLLMSAAVPLPPSWPSDPNETIS
jgi:hypothetical protein